MVQKKRPRDCARNLEGGETVSTRKTGKPAVPTRSDTGKRKRKKEIKTTKKNGKKISEKRTDKCYSPNGRWGGGTMMA